MSAFRVYVPVTGSNSQVVVGALSMLAVLLPSAVEPPNSSTGIGDMPPHPAGADLFVPPWAADPLTAATTAIASATPTLFHRCNAMRLYQVLRAQVNASRRPSRPPL